MNSNKTLAPERVKGIPINSFWVGGADGGQWYLIDNINKQLNIVHFKIYNDFNGELIADKDFRLHCDPIDKIDLDNLKEQINGYDGIRIYLIEKNSNGKYYYFE
jgi:hypothetical protein